VFLFLDILLFTIAAALLVPIGVFFVECSAALWHSHKGEKTPQKSRDRIAVLVPAHNEAAGIGVTLKRLLPQLKKTDKLVVIADNCTDKTAAIARSFGAMVTERNDLSRTGKGYALAHGLKFIEPDSPDVVVIIDADCIPQPGTVEQIAQKAAATGRPVQATYLMKQPANPKPKDAVSALAFMVKNQVRPQGLETMGLPCLLTGTGMAFPWSVIKTAPLASGNIVEDYQLCLDLAIKGYTPVFCSEAKVTSILPQQERAAKGQRTRWEHGHLKTLTQQLPRLLQEFIKQKRWDLLAIALELCVPPLSLLFMIWLSALAVASLATSFGANLLPAILLAIEGLLILLAVIGAWFKFGRQDLPILTLLAVPFYVFWKIPLYLAFLVRPQNRWIRTERD
jgi:cellulose synthase/poly-beta-1,6-N-acetylglucosamine synthase-like glycosyltransferase